jgi:hypothetical protein
MLAKFQVRLVNQRSGLERVAGTLSTQMNGGDAAKLRVERGGELGFCRLISVTQALQQLWNNVAQAQPDYYPADDGGSTPGRVANAKFAVL